MKRKLIYSILAICAAINIWLVGHALDEDAAIETPVPVTTPDTGTSHAAGTGSPR